jgi:hypothetical protein
MLVQQLDETLADHSGRTKDSDGDLLGHLRLIFYISSFANDGIEPQATGQKPEFAELISGTHAAYPKFDAFCPLKPPFYP